MPDQARAGAATPAAELRLALFLTALCTLLSEILLTRLLSVVMWYHFTFAVLSIALLGIAAGSMHCFRWYPRKGADQTFADVASLAFCLFGVATAMPVVLMTTWVDTPTFSMHGGLLLLVYFIVCAAPFYASGFITALIFRYGTGQISGLYAIDMLAGALGCLLALPFLEQLGGVGSLLAVSVVLAGAGVLLGIRAGSGRRIGLAVVAACVLGAMLFMQMTTSRVDLRTVKLSLREEHRKIIDVKWNSHSRLAVLDYFNPDDPSGYPFLSWGLSDRYKGWLPRQYLITIDGASETPITELGPDIKRHEYLAWDVTSLPYHLRPGAKTLVIGAGGGRDLLTSLYFGSKDVTGVELNQGIVDWVKGRYADFAGKLYDRPDVHLHVDDGRNFTRSSKDRFEVLQISMIDTFAATAAGAYTLSENNLYTAEAFDEYLAHLTENGILSINRFFLEPPQQTLRIVTLAREALARRGIKDAAAHIIVVRRNHPLGNNGLVMTKLTPFTKEEVDTVRKLCDEKAFEPIALPGVALSNPFTDYLKEPEPEKFYQIYAFDVRPPNDDRPFFFNTSKIAALLESFSLRTGMEEMRRYNFDAVFILFILLLLAIVALLLFVLVPLRLAWKAGGPAPLPLGPLTYFVWVGLGFILIEVVLIQRYNLYLGHPVYSLAVILVSVLAFSGVGSAITGLVPDKHLKSFLALACTLAIGMAIGLQWAWPWFLEQTLGLALPTRIGLAVVSLIPVGLVLGMPYPTALRLVSKRHADKLPWIWAVNGAASVLGSILAFAMAMAVGFQTVMVIGAICYAAALMTGMMFFRSSPDS